MDTTYKNCFKCGERLPLTEFYAHKENKDGHLNKCKTCTKKDVAERVERKKQDPEWVFNKRECSRLSANRRIAAGRVKKQAGSKKLDKNDPKYKANVAAQYIPSKDGCQRHHWSYQEEHWKDVIILPIKDHAKVHRYMTYDKEHQQYRTVHGVLLDSRELAEQYYDKVLSIKDGIYSELQKLF